MANRTQPSWFELFHHLQSSEPTESHSRRGTMRSSPQFAIDYSCFNCKQLSTKSITDSWFGKRVVVLCLARGVNNRVLDTSMSTCSVFASRKA
jgi:hypothetical protein